MSRGVTLEVPADILAAMVAHCRLEAPREACGLLAGTAAKVAAIFTFRNAEASETRYTADGRDVIHGFRYLRQRRLELLALYHSHPRWRAVPSRTDLRENHYGDVPRIIVSLLDPEPVVRSWRLGEDTFEELRLTVVPPRSAFSRFDAWPGEESASGP